MPPEAVDTNGHVNNVVYVQWMQDVAVRHFRSVGGDEALRAAGAIWVVRSHHVEYLAPAFAGDRLRVETWVVNWQRVRSLRRYRFSRVLDGRLLARGETDWVLVNAQTGRPCTIPGDLRSLFTLLPDKVI